MNVFALSDIHVDLAENRLWLENLSNIDYRNDVLLLAGDVSDRLDRLQASLEMLLGKFAEVFFVPGNHEFWQHSKAQDSMAKFQQIIALCRSLGVKTTPQQVGGRKQLWIVPLLSWYAGPEAGTHSLYVDKPGEDPKLRMWADFYRTRWPHGLDVADAFLAMNVAPQDVPGPVLSFSHFLPRRELIFRNGKIQPITGLIPNDPYPEFNFSRVAGDSRLDALLRRWGSTVHVYGHQHRNRDVVIDGVRYVSQCLGYPLERERGVVVVDGPKMVYDDG